MEQYFQVGAHVPSFGRMESSLDYADTFDSGSKKLGPSRMVEWNGFDFSEFFSGKFPFHSLNGKRPKSII